MAFRQVALRFTILVRTSDGTHRPLSQYGVTIALSTVRDEPRTPLAHHIPRVVRHTTKKQMFWPYASWVVAPMQHILPFSYAAKVPTIGHSMR